MTFKDLNNFMATVGTLHMSGAGALFTPQFAIDAKNPTSNIFDVRYPSGFNFFNYSNRLGKVAWRCPMHRSTLTTTS